MPNSYSNSDANHKEQTQEKYCFVGYGNETANGLLAHLDTQCSQGIFRNLQAHNYRKQTPTQFKTFS